MGLESNFAFKEVQPYGQKWVIYLLIALLVLLISGFITHHFYDTDFGGFKITDQSYWVCIIALALTLAFFATSKITTIINDKGVSYKFPPFQMGYQLYRWNQITDIYVREFSAFEEYGGGGYRVSPNGTALITGSGFGIQIKTTQSENILISTSEKDLASTAISTFYKKNITDK